MGLYHSRIYFMQRITRGTTHTSKKVYWKTSRSCDTQQIYRWGSLCLKWPNRRRGESRLLSGNDRTARPKSLLQITPVRARAQMGACGSCSHAAGPLCARSRAQYPAVPLVISAHWNRLQLGPQACNINEYWSARLSSPESDGEDFGGSEVRPFSFSRFWHSQWRVNQRFVSRGIFF